MIPAERERVRLRGRAGVYFVLGVDLEPGFASVLNLEDGTLWKTRRGERIRLRTLRECLALHERLHGCKQPTSRDAADASSLQSAPRQ